MSMTLLQICNNFALRTSLPQSASVGGSTTFEQLRGLLQEILDDLLSRYTFQGVVEEAQFTTNGAVNFQGDLADIAPLGFLRIRPKTFFNRSLRIEVPGPLTASEFQALQTVSHSGPISWYRIRANSLFMDPIPGEGNLCVFEYISEYAVLGPAPTYTRKQYPTEDGDTFLLPDKLLLAGLRWRWKAEKGFDYAEEFAAYEALAKQLSANSEGARPISLDGQGADARPGVIVPAGTWITPS